MRVASVVADFFLEAPLGATVRASTAALGALGAVDAFAGATNILTLTTGAPGHPSPYTVTAGSQIEAVAFAVTNGGLSVTQASSWTVQGNIPPGLEFGEASNFITQPGILDGTSNPELFGTPTTPGTYTMSLEAWQGPSGTQMGSGFFNYMIIVTAASGGGGGAPSFTIQPISVTSAGGAVALDAVANSSPTYQWFVNGSTPVAGATSSTIVLPDSAATPGSYTCVATNSAGSTTSRPATVAAVSTTDIGRLINLSTRAQVGTDANILIAGFAVGGSGSEPLLVRASGPALTPFGVPGVLADPQLSLNQGSTVLFMNSGWAGNATIAATAAAVGAFPWTSTTSHDSAIATSLGTGAYTAGISGASHDTGVALAEVYDATPAGTFTPASPHLINLSARVMVGTNANILIAGFVVGGTTAKTVLVRASGPALIPFSVPGTLPDPELQLVGSMNVIASNTGWGGSAQIASAASAVGAFPWNSPTSADSAILITLPPGQYTAQVSGASGDTGVALVEVYDVP